MKFFYVFSQIGANFGPFISCLVLQSTIDKYLREGQERQEPKDIAPCQRIEDFKELSEYSAGKRKEFEEMIRRTCINVRHPFVLEQHGEICFMGSLKGESDRSRSVYEKVLDVSPAEIKVLMSYTEMELTARNIQHAQRLRSSFHPSPHLDQLWYKYVFLEELLGNAGGARRYSSAGWEPDERLGAHMSKRR
ncbi:hypothetical protein BT69DRAFT_149204 [Atractiella rhizophila]|nr:hypothetical protein BT69DRAFT_149204 [Atractiella rhizophila]